MMNGAATVATIIGTLVLIYIAVWQCISNNHSLLIWLEFIDTLAGNQRSYHDHCLLAIDQVLSGALHSLLSVNQSNFCFA